MFLGTLLTPHAWASGITEIPFKFSQNLIWIKVQVQGRKEPLNFLFDTGAGATALNRDTAAELGLKFGDSENVLGVNTRSVARWVSGFDAQFAGMPLDKTLLAIDLSAASRACHQRVDGLIGAGFLKGRVVQIDYTAGRIRLLDRSNASHIAGVTLPLRKFTDSYCVPIEVAGNKNQWVRLDTGCDEPLFWVVGRPDEAKNMRPISIALSKSSSSLVRTDIALGPECCCKGIEAAVQTRRIFQDEDGLLGNGILSKFIVTIDMPHKTLILQRNAM